MRLPALDAAFEPTALPHWVWLTLAMLSAAVAVLLWMQTRGRRPRGSSHSTNAMRSGVPGLVPREHFEQALENAVALCDQRSGALCVLLVNLDNLDAVNQGYGHQQADALIAGATARLLAMCGPGVQLARLGGVDFALLAPVDEAAACALAARLCLGLARPLFPVPDRADASMSCSIGLAVYPRHGARQRLVDHASTAMRQVKRAGGWQRLHGLRPESGGRPPRPG